ncbi:hypothetical protein [Burkholderia latens]|nr:hypothetical protein [Burkholderia latens]
MLARDDVSAGVPLGFDLGDAGGAAWRLPANNCGHLLGTDVAIII